MRYEDFEEPLHNAQFLSARIELAEKIQQLIKERDKLRDRLRRMRARSIKELRQKKRLIKNG